MFSIGARPADQLRDVRLHGATTRSASGDGSAEVRSTEGVPGFVVGPPTLLFTADFVVPRWWIVGADRPPGDTVQMPTTVTVHTLPCSKRRLGIRHQRPRPRGEIGLVTAARHLGAGTRNPGRRLRGANGGPVAQYRLIGIPGFTRCGSSGTQPPASASRAERSSHDGDCRAHRRLEPTTVLHQVSQRPRVIGRVHEAAGPQARGQPGVPPPLTSPPHRRRTRRRSMPAPTPSRSQSRPPRQLAEQR